MEYNQLTIINQAGVAVSDIVHTTPNTLLGFRSHRCPAIKMIWASVVLGTMAHMDPGFARILAERDDESLQVKSEHTHHHDTRRERLNVASLHEENLCVAVRQTQKQLTG